MADGGLHCITVLLHQNGAILVMQVKMMNGNVGL